MALNSYSYQGASTAYLMPATAWIDDVEAWLAHSWDWFDPIHAHRLFWPDRPYQPGMEILVAGCGPSQAAVIAYTNPQARVTAIDIDEAALNHEVYLRHKHKLLNLEVRPLQPTPIEEVSSLNRDFDLIIASGVLEHLESPECAMTAMAEVMRPDGVTAVALGARCTAATENVAENRTFTVDDCLNLVEETGLVFQDWFHKSGYYPADADWADDELTAGIRSLEERKMWSVMERLNYQIGNHLFMACRPEREAESYRINFASGRAADYVPHRRHGAALNVARDQVEVAIANAVDGRDSIRQIAERTQSDLSRAVDFFRRMWLADSITVDISTEIAS